MKEKEMNIIMLDEKSYLLKSDNQAEILPIESLNMILSYPNINYTNEANSIGIAKVINNNNVIKYDLYRTNSLGHTNYSRKFLTREELINEAINQIIEKNNVIKIKCKGISHKKRRKILNLFKK